jgi:hypothetical protein
VCLPPVTVPSSLGTDDVPSLRAELAAASSKVAALGKMKAAEEQRCHQLQRCVRLGPGKPQ